MTFVWFCFAVICLMFYLLSDISVKYRCCFIHFSEWNNRGRTHRMVQSICSFAPWALMLGLFVLLQLAMPQNCANWKALHKRMRLSVVLLLVPDRSPLFLIVLVQQSNQTDIVGYHSFFSSFMYLCFTSISRATIEILLSYFYCRTALIPRYINIILPLTSVRSAISD